MPLGHSHLGLQHYFLQQSVRSSCSGPFCVFCFFVFYCFKQDFNYYLLISHMPFSLYFTPGNFIYPLCFSMIIHYKRWVLYTCLKTQVTLPNQRISDLQAGPGCFWLIICTWQSSCWKAVLITHKCGSTSSQTPSPPGPLGGSRDAPTKRRKGHLVREEGCVGAGNVGH